jgi:hypothetical protein
MDSAAAKIQILGIVNKSKKLRISSIRAWWIEEIRRGSHGHLDEIRRSNKYSSY